MRHIMYIINFKVVCIDEIMSKFELNWFNGSGNTMI